MYCKFSCKILDKFTLVRINSSKVYCKLMTVGKVGHGVRVLIVAKCIVNLIDTLLGIKSSNVLIVAKCIVN